MFSNSLSRFKTGCTMLHLQPDACMRDLLIKEVRGGASRTEIPVLVNIAEDYFRRDPAIRTGGCAIRLDGSKRSTTTTTINDDNSTNSVASSSIKACVDSVYAPMCTHSKRRLSGSQIHAHVRRLVEVTNASNNNAKKWLSENNNEKSSGEEQQQQEQIFSLESAGEIFRQHNLALTGTVSKQMVVPAFETFSDSYYNDNSNSNNNKECLFSPSPPQTTTTTKFASKYEKQIFDIIFSLESENIPNYLIRERIINEVLLPFIHNHHHNNNNENKILAISISELLRVTNYHKYASSALNSHCILEKELCAVLTSPSSSKSGLSQLQQEEVNQVVLVKPGWIVSLKAKNWVEFAEKNSCFNVVEMLFGKEEKSKYYNTKRQQVKLLLNQPSFAKMLMPQNASKFRCDLLDLGYDLSSDLLTMIKI
jgi:hypothetical protein